METTDIQETAEKILKYMRIGGTNGVSSEHFAQMARVERRVADHALRELENDGYVQREVISSMRDSTRTLWYLIDA